MVVATVATSLRTGKAMCDAPLSRDSRFPEQLGERARGENLIAAPVRDRAAGANGRGGRCRLPIGTIAL